MRHCVPVFVARGGCDFRRGSAVQDGVGFFGPRRAQPPAMPMDLRPRNGGATLASFLIPLLSSALLLSGCEATPPPPKRIIFLSMDTVRADHVNGYGPGDTTPELAKIAAEGVLFRDFYGASTYTIPSHMSIFTGLDPNPDFVKDSVETDKFGFITTSGTMETSLEGVFAAGDARGGSTKQVASAVGEGVTAALMIRQYLERTQGSRAYKGD